MVCGLLDECPWLAHGWRVVMVSIRARARALEGQTSHISDRIRHRFGAHPLRLKAVSGASVTVARRGLRAGAHSGMVGGVDAHADAHELAIMRARVVAGRSGL